MVRKFTAFITSFGFLIFLGFGSAALAAVTISGTGITGDTLFNIFSSATSTTIDVGGGNTLNLQNTNNGPITTGSGLFTVGGNFTVTGKSTLANASSTALTVSGPLVVSGTSGLGAMTFTNATGSNLSLSGTLGVIGATTLGNVNITGNATTSGLTLTNVATGIQCLHASATGVVTGTGADCGGSGSTGANPTAALGLAAINGSASTFMRSDAAPALSQAIIPTWTGLHTFTGGLTVSSTSTFSGNIMLPNFEGSLFYASSTGLLLPVTIGSNLTLSNGTLSASGGGGGSPGGSDTYVQFNDGGVFNGTAGMTFNKTAGVLTVGGILAKGNPNFNVKAYGAVGDGSADDTTAVASALSAASTTFGTIYFPPGTYKVTSALTPSASTTIECGSGAVIERFTASTDLFTLTANNVSIRNCTLDGNAQNGGSAATINANDITLDRNTIQNFGTNSGTGWVYATGGSRLEATRNKILGAGETGLAFVANSGSLVTVLIADNYIEGTADGTYGLKIMSNTGNLARDFQVQRNRFRVKSTCVYATNQGSGEYINRSSLVGNDCQITAAAARDGYSLYGWSNGTIAANVFADNGFSRTNQAAFAIHDTVGTAITGNTAYTSGNNGRGFQLLDTRRSTFVGNYVGGDYSGSVVQNGFKNTQIGISFDSSSGSADLSQNVIANNIVIGPPAWTGIGIRISCVSGASNNCSNYVVEGNSIRGSGTASSTGIVLSRTNGTFDAPLVANNSIWSMETGISISSGVTNARVGAQQFSSVTTPVVDASSGSSINTHSVRGTAALSAGAATTTLSGIDVFTSSTSYQCTASDNTAPNAVAVAIASSTAFTLTGTGSDTVSYICSGY